PEFYDNLKYHSSWTRLLFQFVFDERYSLYSRIERMQQRANSPAPPCATTSPMSSIDLSARPINFEFMAVRHYVSKKNETLRMFESYFVEYFSRLQPSTPVQYCVDEFVVM